MIITQLVVCRSSPVSTPAPFHVVRDGVHLEFKLYDGTVLDEDILIGALQVQYDYILRYGARNVQSLIICEEELEEEVCGKFRVWFEPFSGTI